MQEQYMMVNPNDLVIDLPVDEANVAVIMESLQRNGRMIEPVTVCLSTMRIINGFHRTEAAKRLGWQEMPCLVKDMTEDEFWDARIIAAKPHKEVEPARMAAWMLESWQKSYGVRSLDTRLLNTYLDRLGIVNRPTDKQLQMFALIDALTEYEPDARDWSRRIEIGTEKVQSGFTKTGRRRFHLRTIYKKRDATELEQWFESKSAKWGVSVQDAAEKISSVARQLIGFNVVLSGDKLYSSDVSSGDSLPENSGELARVISEREAKQQYPLYTPEWANDVLDGKATVADIDTYALEAKRRDELIEEQRLEEEKVYQARLEAKRQEEERRREEDRKLYSSMASSLASKKSRLVRDLAAVRFHLSDLGDISDISEAPAILADFAQFIADFAEKNFPGIDIAQPNPVSLENSRIRAENARLKERIASLERALGSKESAGGMIAKSMAWSSTDFEN